MRKLTVLPLALAGTFAGPISGGTSTKAPVPLPIAVVEPAQTPNYYQWFAGATGGYLLDNECEFFSAHVGTDMPYQLWGWDTAAFLEIGYFGCDFSETVTGFNTREEPPGEECDEYDKYSKKGPCDDEPGDGGGGPDNEGPRTDTTRISYDLDIIPITLNYKLERQISENLSFYWGLGAGVAIIDLDAKGGGDDETTTFFAQGFAGVLYNVNPDFELFTGTRVVYFDDPSFRVDGVDVDPDLEEVDAVVEAGLRFNF